MVNLQYFSYLLTSMGKIKYEIVHIILKSAFDFRENWCSISHVSLMGVNIIYIYFPHI